MAYMEEEQNIPLRDVLAIIQRRMKRSTYFGVPAQKFPLDCWIYQEIIFETKPDVIVEVGNLHGGGTLYLAHLCDLMGAGRLVAVDISHAVIPDIVRDHRRITFIEGDACRCFGQVRTLIAENETVLVIEDSSHTYQNTLNVLRTYSPLIQPGQYFIVEDGIIGHGLPAKRGELGPYGAIETFVAENPDFEIDRGRESFLLTWNPKGYLKRTN